MSHTRMEFASAILGTLLVGSAAAKDTAGKNAVLKSGELKALIQNAKTPADHRKLAAHYAAVAAKHEAEAKEHEELAALYAKSPTAQGIKHPMSPQTAEHCKMYAEHCHKAASEMKAMSARHLAMAEGK